MFVGSIMSQKTLPQRKEEGKMLIMFTKIYWSYFQTKKSVIWNVCGAHQIPPQGVISQLQN